MLTDDQIEGASNLDDLSKMVSVCDRCELSKSKKRDVFGTGKKNAQILFIGEAPGKEEDLQGKPFVGGAGKFLDKLLSEVGYKREEVYIANVLKHRPPANRDPYPDEITACWPFLKKQIEIINPEIIVFLGRHSLNRFFPGYQISKVHGKEFKKNWGDKSRIFLALYHPAAALYNGALRETLIADFKKIPKILEKVKKETIQDRLF